MLYLVARILKYLFKSDRTVGECTAEHIGNLPNIIEHLIGMRDGGLIKKGGMIFEISRPHLQYESCHARPSTAAQDRLRRASKQREDIKIPTEHRVYFVHDQRLN